ncbi:hypothetical protein SAMN06265365_14831 [Tistlia consotensis]|uniref:Transcriptional regulator, ArsR family n=1 Tax=Tistlia consotensis USBA 355 TaxID=560819 RepID=A0A1Y6CRB6_9PROT|nr:hypothetical protein [Tistlia consotensis]SMF82982.1 hypothetical protein SAMN05428998_14832 [Tistlia consotensis USBA 355]SNS31648.1 hypothetical protein SAMN06265365_14831 [Tistlia consotensis]
MSYQDDVGEHIRLAILRILEGAPGYAANDSVLHDKLPRLALSCSRAQVRTHLAWLRDQGLLALEEVAPGLFVATLAEAGADVAKGLTTVPGVKRPSAR